MKRILLSAFILAAASFFVSAQSEAQPDMYVKSAPITKIYLMKEGYRVLYLTSEETIGEFYVPISWFDPSVGKASLISGNNPAFPYFSIFWKDGKFFFVRLYVKPDFSDPSWGVTPTNFDPKGKFDSTTLDLKW